MLTPALLCAALLLLGSTAVAADPQRPIADAPAGWSAHDGAGGLHYFTPPGGSDSDVYEAVFPTQKMNGTLEQTAAGIWRAIVGNERIVDTKSKAISVRDGAPAYEVIVASLDARNLSVYRVFIVKQYGRSVAAGELRFTDVQRIADIGEAAFASLEGMSVPRN